ncbi:restriction endonuclease [Campylobacter upsaliensis]|nr:restriction endonuclease [Campylobacter upsaliensis]
MARRIQKEKWILYRHTRNFNLLVSLAEILKSFSKTQINKEDKKKLNLHLKKLGLYNERNPNLVLDAISHKINQLSFYMFGYQAKINGNKRFLFSPLGNLFLKNINNESIRAKIFLTMLWGLQFEHPHGGSDKKFRLYPFRLIFKLLSDERLDYKLYAYEVAYLVVFVEAINKNIYENLVANTLSLRAKTHRQIADLFHSDSHTYVNAVYEWDYYTSNLLCSAGILQKTSGEIITHLQHGNTNTFRKITSNSVAITHSLKDFVLKLEKSDSFLNAPLLLNDSERLSIDVVKEIYSYYPKILLESIGAFSDEVQSYLEIPKLIETYSNNPNKETSDLFENVLVDGFNMFYNIEAKKLSGAGKTDIECLYITKRKKFAVEAKSTANKLLGINTSRLKEHREHIGGEYTIIITPRYVPAAKRDIRDTPNVIILANTFAEYLYNCIDNNIRKIDYDEFDTIIMQNLGKDISEHISNLSILKFGLGK